VVERRQLGQGRRALRRGELTGPFKASARLPIHMGIRGRLRKPPPFSVPCAT
jgi:hypothetical protein